MISIIKSWPLSFTHLSIRKNSCLNSLNVTVQFLSTKYNRKCHRTFKCLDGWTRITALIYLSTWVTYCAPRCRFILLVPRFCGYYVGPWPDLSCSSDQEVALQHLVPVHTPARSIISRPLLLIMLCLLIKTLQTTAGVNMQVSKMVTLNCQLGWVWAWLIVCLCVSALWWTGDPSRVCSFSVSMSAHSAASFRTPPPPTFLLLLGEMTTECRN